MTTTVPDYVHPIVLPLAKGYQQIILNGTTALSPYPFTSDISDNGKKVAIEKAKVIGCLYIDH